MGNVVLMASGGSGGVRNLSGVGGSGAGVPSRAEYVEGIKADWHGGRESILRMGRRLIEAKMNLARGDFEDMIKRDLPFGPRSAQRFMRIAMDPRLSNATQCVALPGAVETLTELERLTDDEFEAGIAQGVIRENATRADIVAFRREIRGDHRPQAVASIGAPRRPERAGATCYEELVYILAEWRKSRGISQIEFDEKAGWTNGQTSKYEIPHTKDGRTMTFVPSVMPDGAVTQGAFWESLQTLGLGIKLVPLS